MFTKILLPLAVLSGTMLMVWGCAKKQPSPMVVVAPEEPIQKLAWESARRTRSGMRSYGADSLQLRSAEIENRANLPKPAFDYFLNSLRQQLKIAGFDVTDSSDRLFSGVLTLSEERLIFSFRVSSQGAIQYSDSAAVPDDSRFRNSLAQFEAPAEPPRETTVDPGKRKIPTPLFELQNAPLDVHPVCRAGAVLCEILFLYQDRLVVENWISGTRQEVPLLGFSAMRSRAPSGKIHSDSDGYTVMHNNLSAPIRLGPDLSAAPPGPLPLLPVPEQGTNMYVLADGRFYDFELVEGRILVAVDTKYYLNVAERGNLAVSLQKVGSTVAASLPAIYTSSYVPPGSADAVMKFQYNNGRLVYETSRPINGEILDIARIDLNRDKTPELLITLRTGRGIFVEALDPF